MKAKALRIGKAMSAALFVLLLVVAGMKNALAQTQVATLQHGDDVSVFYGSNALAEAHAAAETGDIITLSSGTFVPCEITKAITLRGAGCVKDTISGGYPTVISGTIIFNVTDTENYLTVEGIYFSAEGYYDGQFFKELHNPKFIKCNFNRYRCYNANYDYYNSYDAQFTNCMFKNFRFENSHNTTLINCVAWVEGSWNEVVTAFNSIVYLLSSVRNWSVYNCIIIHNTNNNNTLGEYCAAYNCIGFQNPYTVFGSATYNCIEIGGYQDVFETFGGFEGNFFDFEEPFVLKDEIATGFLGNDGTEVGIHGGIMPYSSRPTYMIMKRCNVANKSTIDGKLSVDIEVVTEE